MPITQILPEHEASLIGRITEASGRYAQTRRLLILDRSAPEVVQMVPSDGSERIDPNTMPLVLFSEPILHSTLSATDGLSLTRLGTGTSVTGQVAVAGNAVAFIPASAMAAGRTRGIPVPWGVSLLRVHSGAVVGEACPLVSP